MSVILGKIKDISCKWSFHSRVDFYWPWSEATNSSPILAISLHEMQSICTGANFIRAFIKLSETRTAKQ